MRACGAGLVALVATASWGQMLYDQGPPKYRLVHKQMLAARVNPLGLFYEGRLSFRLRLYESPSVALRDNFVGVGAFGVLAAAYGHVGPYIEVQPLSVLGFWATYMFSQYFRTFNLFQSFPSANSDFSDATIRAQGALPSTEPLSNYFTNGGQLIVGANFQAKVWQIMLRSKARLVRSDYALREGDTVFYDQGYDALVPNHGWFLTNDLDVAWQRADNKLVVGVRYTASTAFYDGRQYLDGEEQTNLNATHRVGPVVAYIFRVQDGAAFNEPTVFLLAQWWLQHRYRTGAETTQALPLIAIGFLVSGDLLPH